MDHLLSKEQHAQLLLMSMFNARTMGNE